jgi:pantoate--beta-alanine ligase
MEVIQKAARMRAVTAGLRAEGKSIGFVPTMGHLHEGHLSLVRHSLERSDETVVSVFVNPAQFGEGEDFEEYPRDILRDTDLLVKEGVQHIFYPTPEEMYPPGFRTYVEPEEISRVLEGAVRPGHFRGVCTVVLKLLNIVRPHLAVFGWKDAQQAAVIEQMVRDLDVPVEVLRAPTVREADGLAMSSRNTFLEPEDRKAAAVIYKALRAGRDLYVDGERDAAEIRRKVQDLLEAEERVREVDYVATVDPHTFQDVLKIKEGPVVLATALRIGKTRLIDNVVLEAGKD